MTAPDPTPDPSPDPARCNEFGHLMSLHKATGCSLAPDPAVEGLAGVGVWLNHDDPRDEWPGINEWTVEGIAAFAADAEDVFWTAYHRTCESDGEDAGAALGSHHEAIARRILTGPELAARDAAQQRIGAERALREAARDGANQNTPEGFAIWLLLTDRADRIAQEEA